ncbi:hypothetical protein ECE50_007485 [Chitinophaga sp. Mgbs1]|uniref:Uncharacterized protein n=1 Tax=Chitinophaga solisilvae TaxID=1233460 RepID=A0A433WE99_9BACT|nr:hypothetical protein [Chitinophaga solisilvae]
MKIPVLAVLAWLLYACEHVNAPSQAVIPENHILVDTTNRIPLASLTLTDGKKIVVFDNGTWIYASEETDRVKGRGNKETAATEPVRQSFSGSNSSFSNGTCGHPTRKGGTCRRRVRGGGYCWQHGG